MGQSSLITPPKWQALKLSYQWASTNSLCALPLFILQSESGSPLSSWWSPQTTSWHFQSHHLNILQPSLVVLWGGGGGGGGGLIPTRCTWDTTSQFHGAIIADNSTKMTSLKIVLPVGFHQFTLCFAPIYTTKWIRKPLVILMESVTSHLYDFLAFLTPRLKPIHTCSRKKTLVFTTLEQVAQARPAQPPILGLKPKKITETCINLLMPNSLSTLPISILTEPFYCTV